MCKVSIITSVYNTEEYLKKSFDSVLNQTFKDFEFIVINNGSTDNSMAIIDEYMRKDKRIKLINNETNKFLSEARNQALDIANGKYIYVVDSDDYIELDTLDTIVKEAERNDLDLVVFGWLMEYYINNDFVALPVKPSKNLFLNKDDFRKNAASYLNQSILTVPWNKLYKREIIVRDNVKYRNTKLEDHHFNMDYIKNVEKVSFLSNTFYHYFRSRPGSELNYIYKFDLFTKKLEHYQHTKEVFQYWNLEDKKSWEILYTYFAERIIQCIQEIQANNSFTKKEKNNKIKFIFNNEEAIYAIKKSNPDSILMKLMIIPLKIRWIWLCKIEAKFITWYKENHNEKFIKIRAKNVNKSE